MSQSDDRAFGRTPDAMDEGIVDETLGDEEMRDGIDAPRLSDDRDLEPGGNGLEDTPWRHEYRTVTLRSDLARIFENLLAGVTEWADEDGSEEARALVSELEDLYVWVGDPVEETDPAAQGGDEPLDRPA